MKVVVCDDVLQDAESAKQIIEKVVSSAEIYIESPKEVYVAVEEGVFDCDIMVMDVQFKDEKFDGIELGGMLNQKLPVCQIIYLTKMLEFAPMVYETKHCYFVMKEDMASMLPRAIDKAVCEYNGSYDHDIISFLSAGHKVFMAQRDIVYIERDDRVLKIHAQSKDYTCYSSLKQLERKLIDKFVRCHGGFIVNLDYVTGMEKFETFLSNGAALPVGKRFYENYKSKYLEYHEEKFGR